MPSGHIPKSNSDREGVLVTPRGEPLLVKAGTGEQDISWFLIACCFIAFAASNDAASTYTAVAGEGMFILVALTFAFLISMWAQHLLGQSRAETFLVDGGLVVEELSLLFGRSTLKLPAESVALRIEEYSDDSGGVHFSLVTETPYGREIELMRGNRTSVEAARDKLLAALESQRIAARPA